MAQTDSNACGDGNVEALVALLRSRSAVGVKKYGTTTEREDLTLVQWLGHAIEEGLDQVVYLMAAKRMVERLERTGPVVLKIPEGTPIPDLDLGMTLEPLSEARSKIPAPRLDYEDPWRRWQHECRVYAHPDATGPLREGDVVYGYDGQTVGRIVSTRDCDGVCETPETPEQAERRKYNQWLINLVIGGAASTKHPIVEAISGKGERIGTFSGPGVVRLDPGVKVESGECVYIKKISMLDEWWMGRKPPTPPEPPPSPANQTITKGG